MAVKKIADLKALFETTDVLLQASFVDLIDSCYNNLPMNVGAYLSTGSVFINDSDAGFYWSLPTAATTNVVGNIPLDTYTGDNLKLTLKGRINSAPSASDDVDFSIIYAFIKTGDNSATESTTIATQTVVVDAKTANVNFDIVLGNMTGEVGATTLMIGIKRLGSADTFGGNYEIIDAVLDYV